MSSHILAIDQDDSGVGAYVFEHDGREVSMAYSEIPLSGPRPSWAERDATALRERMLARPQP